MSPQTLAHARALVFIGAAFVALCLATLGWLFLTRPREGYQRRISRRRLLERLR